MAGQFESGKLAQVVVVTFFQFMPTVKLTGWQKGFQKISLTKIIRKHTGYGLSEGKKCTDDVLDGKIVIFPNLNNEVAGRLLEEVRSVGVLAEMDLGNTVPIER